MDIIRQMSQNPHPRVTYGNLLDILPVIRGKRRKRFLSKINRTPAGPKRCHLWIGHTNQTGYGLVQGSIDYEGYSFLAHRVAWAIKHQREPGDLVIRHSCDNPRCCNESHLIKGTQQDNVDDRTRRGRAQFGLNGRPFDLIGYTEAIRLRFEEQLPILAIVKETGRHRATISRWIALHLAEHKTKRTRK